jgi:dephospho-CoA kinase
MPVFGITGGIATGKSSFIGLLEDRMGGDRAIWFDADLAAKKLLETDKLVRHEIYRTFGDPVFTESGEIDRDALRKAAFATDDTRHKLNAILHPKVRSQWSALAAEARKSKMWLFVEIALLYETSGHELCDKVIVVACSQHTQIRRITGARGLTESMANQIIASQSSLGEKCRMADFLIWNDAALTSLERQCSLLVSWLNKTYA